MTNGPPQPPTLLGNHNLASALGIGVATFVTSFAIGAVAFKSFNLVGPLLLGVVAAIAYEIYECHKNEQSDSSGSGGNLMSCLAGKMTSAFVGAVDDVQRGVFGSFVNPIAHGIGPCKDKDYGQYAIPVWNIFKAVKDIIGTVKTGRCQK